jgi:hypothetical protein
MSIVSKPQSSVPYGIRRDQARKPYVCAVTRVVGRNRDQARKPYVCAVKRVVGRNQVRKVNRQGTGVTGRVK